MSGSSVLRVNLSDHVTARILERPPVTEQIVVKTVQYPQSVETQHRLRGDRYVAIKRIGSFLYRVIYEEEYPGKVRAITALTPVEKGRRNRKHR